MTAQMYDFTCKGVFAIPEFGIKTAWQSHGSYEDGPFQLGARTHLGFWEYLKEVPARMQLFSAGMRSQVTVGNGRRSGAFLFGEVLGKDPCAEDEVAIVDVGGGRGQALETIKADYPELQGRMVLQDLADVIDDAKASGLPPFIEAQTGSFFGPQAIKGAWKAEKSSGASRTCAPCWFDDGKNLADVKSPLQALASTISAASFTTGTKYTRRGYSPLRARP